MVVREGFGSFEVIHQSFAVQIHTIRKICTNLITTLATAVLQMQALFHCACDDLN